MEIYIVLTCFITMVSADFYSSRYDNFDVDPLIENDRIMLSYSKCFLDQGPCPPDAKDFKKVIPETMETACGKCTAKQKELIRKVIRAVKERHPDAWDQFIEKYDQSGKFRDHFNEFIQGKDK